MTNIKKIIDYLKISNIKYTYIGDDSIQIKQVSLPDKVSEYSLVWIKDSELIKNYIDLKVKNVVFVTGQIDFYLLNLNVIFSENSKELFFSIVSKFFDEKANCPSIGNSSTILTNRIGKGVSIGENCFIGSEVIIGDNVIIKNNVVIESKVTIGPESIIYSGVVIGSDGYGYFKDSKGLNIKVPHLGGVLIGKFVEIGANTCIDRGTIGDTVIGDNVKIDNLCHIAHNVIIENNVCVIALSMIAGSVILKENSYIAPSASIRNQLTIGKNSLVGIGAVVVKDVKDNVVVAGVPAKIIQEQEIK